MVGLAVMGANLALNIADHGFPIAVYNRTPVRTRELMEGEAQGKPVVGAETLQDFVAKIERPRRIIILVKAGPAVDGVIAELLPLLDDGDVIIDGGNSFFQDTIRRDQQINRGAGGPYFMGMGVSGGEEGARHGPSLMPGGPKEAYALLEPALTKIAAQVADGPCVSYIGPSGAGHYVKMVHNGIEYGDMQLIAETYNIMKGALGLSAPEMGEIFARWNEGRLNSYLIEITAKVLAFIDADTKQSLVDLILDEAEQKGTGRWTSQNAIELGIPIPTIDAAVWSRGISALKPQRVAASQVLQGPDGGGAGGDGAGPNGAGAAIGADRGRLLGALEGALYAAKVSSYAQGMALLRAASDHYGFELNLSELARIWKGGCIIRARLLDTIQRAFERNPQLDNLLLDPGFAEAVNGLNADWRYVVGVARDLGLPCPALSASLDYFDSYRAERLPANLIQGLRDFFGAHTYRRVDREGTFHTIWEPEVGPVEEAVSVPTTGKGATGEDEPAEKTVKVDG
ncbi:MAG: NADP-dependent phosphogluconate dehydrogenase [Chloroflexota bacterium]|nr:NADP-dependent phosphogluconate dehydrogenase [Chloroflexota bacterium]